MLARVLLAQDHPRPALALLDRLHAPAAGLDRTGSVIEIQALQALALAASGDEAAAVDRLAAALTLACPRGYVRVFADEGAPNQRIAEQLVVTLDTVKKHITHVLGKLGAANRTKGVARARQLGLIP